MHAALEAFQQLDVKPPMISLAKKEELIPCRSGGAASGWAGELGLRLCQRCGTSAPVCITIIFEVEEDVEEE